nr:zinc finger, CCHC-type [Tanacetum cinerariifolium]
MTTSIENNSQVPHAAAAAHAAWVKGQKEVVVLMLLTMDLDIQWNLSNLGAYDMLQELTSMFSKQAEQELLESYLSLSDKDYDNFVHNYNMHDMGNTVNELHAMLKLHEDTLPKKDSNPALHAIRAGRVQKNQKNKSHKVSKGGSWCFVSVRGDGYRAAVEAIETYHLELPSGLVIVLNNCHYAPSITRGHISKKCIEKLQHDGLLNSIDIESLGKCVSFMSGKMSRKPYSHQVERAKGLLKLIHTDGCEALVKCDTLTKPDKLDPRSFRCIFVGYPKETIGYSFYSPSEKKVFVTWNAEFFENDNIKSRFQQNPGEEHWTAVKNILKYLRNTKDIFLVYRGNMVRELRVSCYTDVGYLTDADDLKSQTGYVFVLNGGAVNRKSTKQSIFAASSTDAKYIGAFDASKEAVWIRKFIMGLVLFPQLKNP